MKYGLIGNPLEHSYSPNIHALFGNQDYQLYPLLADNLVSFLQEADFHGLNVTIPYKKAVLPYCVLSPKAQEIGSVNTILNQNGRLEGHNTDYSGFLYLAQRTGVNFYGQKVLILGNGGAAQTVKTAAGDKGAKEIIIVSRLGENNYQNIHEHYDANILINTTPVGMFPDNYSCPADLTPFYNLKHVLDLIYNPLNTVLTQAATTKGIANASGLAMLVAQAWYAHKLFFNITSNVHQDEQTIEKAVNIMERRLKNLIIIGMPGCGKTTLGNHLAKKLNRPFIDTDLKIQEETGRTPSEIIQSNGEDAFRNIESQIISTVTKKTGQVIAIGGGGVLYEKNRSALRQNGWVIYLDAPLEELDIKGRPLSASPAALAQMEPIRRPIYQALANQTIFSGKNKA
ncbi:MAG: AAA family ATPase, partial [Chloroflexi bacterium]|nr:AAA family ATPase [Chloroflexota bacterium]